VASATIGARVPLDQAQRPNQIWVLDFISDMLETGWRSRVFNVEDQITREGPAADFDTSLPGPRVARGAPYPDQRAHSFKKAV
jgi:putative transposase